MLFIGAGEGRVPHGLEDAHCYRPLIPLMDVLEVRCNDFDVPAGGIKRGNALVLKASLRTTSDLALTLCMQHLLHCVKRTEAEDQLE